MEPTPFIHPVHKDAHIHNWQFAAMGMNQIQNRLTQQVTNMPTIVMVCWCSAVLHRYVPSPISYEEVAGGNPVPQKAD